MQYSWVWFLSEILSEVGPTANGWEDILCPQFISFENYGFSMMQF